ncbi:MAG TPA: PTS sugar transporter subunit IIA, partial [Candidatus Sabulitectum sp.]|nr:PTS sugar transporter subunit IIA [Candidatus Sabulitectum sp.]HPR23174.1 PTS sugar transporter subunit IIA [Candidatus Sabulitectum sp.]
MNISDILSITGCKRKLAASQRDEALGVMAELLSKSPNAGGVTPQALLQGMQEREALGSTGVGNGVAIPHCRLPGMKGFALALSVCDRGIAWNSIDHRSVHIICAIAGPMEGTEDHLRLLAGAARVLNNGKARYELLNAQTEFAMREAFLYHLS